MKSITRRAGGRIELSDRETEVLLGIATGLSNAQIAEAAGIAPSTVATHTRNMMTVLGVDTRAAAVLEGCRRGLLARLLGGVLVPFHPATPQQSTTRVVLGAICSDRTRRDAPIRIETGQWITVAEARARASALVSAIHHAQGGPGR